MKDVDFEGSFLLLPFDVLDGGEADLLRELGGGESVLVGSGVRDLLLLSSEGILLCSGKPWTLALFGDGRRRYTDISGKVPSELLDDALPLRLKELLEPDQNRPIMFTVIKCHYVDDLH